MLTHIRHEPRQRSTRHLIALLTVAAAAGAAAAAAASSNPAELLTSAKTLAPLKTAVTYQASSFPIPLRVAPTDPTWRGAQTRTTKNGRPAFGWVAVGHPPVDKPRGLISIETAFGPTPSVAATIARLRTGGSHLPDNKIGGTTFQEPSAVTLSAYSGRQFDGEVWGKWGHAFIPFSPTTHGASPPDTLYLHKGETFRFIVLDVRGKSLVLLLESFALPPEQFPAFLTSANTLLKSLKLPG